MTVMNMSGMSEKGTAIAGNIFKGIFHPDLKFLFALDTSGVGYLLLQTIAIAILGTLIGAIIAVPLSFLSATNMMPAWVAYVIRFFIMALRTVPPFVYGLMFIRVTGPGPSAGALTLGLMSIGMISKLLHRNHWGLGSRDLGVHGSSRCDNLPKNSFWRYASAHAWFLVYLALSFGYEFAGC